MDMARGDRYNLHEERFHLDVRNFFFYSENNQSLEQHPWGCGEVPISGGVQAVLGQGGQ